MHGTRRSIDRKPKTTIHQIDERINQGNEININFKAPKKETKWNRAKCMKSKWISRLTRRNCWPLESETIPKLRFKHPCSGHSYSLQQNEEPRSHTAKEMPNFTKYQIECGQREINAGSDRERNQLWDWKPAFYSLLCTTETPIKFSLL